MLPSDEKTNLNLLVTIVSDYNGKPVNKFYEHNKFMFFNKFFIGIHKIAGYVSAFEVVASTQLFPLMNKGP